MSGMEADRSKGRSWDGCSIHIRAGTEHKGLAGGAERPQRLAQPGDIVFESFD